MASHYYVRLGYDRRPERSGSRGWRSESVSPDVGALGPGGWVWMGDYELKRE